MGWLVTAALAFVALKTGNVNFWIPAGLFAIAGAISLRE